MSEKIVQLNEEIIKGQIKELVRGSVEETLNELLEKEAESLTQAARYERSEARQGYRSGHYDRNLTTTSGDVTLHMPRLKGVSFETAIIERYRRRESSVEEALIEMYLAGVSVRRVEDITEALWGSKVSPATISELNKKAYVHIEDWRNRPLQGGRYPYVYVDGIYLRRNWGGEYENVAILVAILIGVVLATGIGYLYGLLLNRVKGSEMTVTTYVGFSVIAFMNMVWMLLPFDNGELIWPNAGKGMRNTISLASSFSEVMNKTMAFGMGDFLFPTGLLLFFFLMCFLVWLFMRSKTGMAMTAAGANPMFAKAAGINVNKMRLIGTTISTVLAAVGILVYAQGFGFMQLYNGPMMMGFTSVAAVLIGGATPKRALIVHVLIGTFLFQGIMTLGLPVVNQIIPEGNLSEVMRMIISNGIIIYALTQAKGGDGRE